MRSEIVGAGSPRRRDEVLSTNGLGNSTLTKNRFLLHAFLTSAGNFYALRIILLLCDDVRRFPCDDNLLICWYDENLRPAIDDRDFAFAGVTFIPFWI